MSKLGTPGERKRPPDLRSKPTPITPKRHNALPPESKAGSTGGVIKKLFPESKVTMLATGGSSSGNSSGSNSGSSSAAGLAVSPRTGVAVGGLLKGVDLQSGGVTSAADGGEEYWWVPDDIEVYAIGVQAGPLPNGLFMFNVDSKQLKVNKDLCYRANIRSASDMQAPDDLVSIPDINPPSILMATKIRFQQKKIYTDIGSVLMSLNPFEVLPDLYGPEVIKRYENPFAGGLAPHVYMIPARAFHALSTTGQNQSILISGESGAGKTEATKQCLSYLTAMASSSSEGTESSLD